MSATKTKGKHSGFRPIESFKEIVTGVGDSLKNDLGKALPQESWAQFIGVDPHAPSNESNSNQPPKKESPAPTSHSGDLAPNQWLNLLQITTPKEQKAPSKEAKPNHIDPGISYHGDIARSTERSLQHHHAEKNQEIQQVRQQLIQMLAESGQQVQQKFTGITLEPSLIRGGIYHANFYEKATGWVHQARQNAESGGSWLTSVRGKNSKKGLIQDSWSKGNTSVTMSNERALATATG